MIPTINHINSIFFRGANFLTKSSYLEEQYLIEISIPRECGKA